MFKEGDVVILKKRFKDYSFMEEYNHPSRVEFTQNDLVKVVHLSGPRKDIPTFWTAVSLEYAKDYYLDEFARQL